VTEKPSGPDAALRWICVGAGILIAWGGIQMALLAAGNVRGQMALAHSHTRANASVLGIRWEKHDLGRRRGVGVSNLQGNDFVDVCYVKFHFAADGHDVQREVDFGVSDPRTPPYHAGDILPVMYRPHHPEEAVVDIPGSIWGPIIAPGGAALLLFIFAGALFYVFHRMSRGD
jgi:hypothetical protein